MSLNHKFLRQSLPFQNCSLEMYNIMKQMCSDVINPEYLFIQCSTCRVPSTLRHMMWCYFAFNSRIYTFIFCLFQIINCRGLYNGKVLRVKFWFCLFFILSILTTILLSFGKFVNASCDRMPRQPELRCKIWFKNPVQG